MSNTNAESSEVSKTQFITMRAQMPNIASIDPISAEISRIDPFADRIALARHPIAIRIFEIMREKQSNLCVSADLCDAASLLRLVEAVAPYICILKLHYDTIDGFDSEFMSRLIAASRKWNFLIFEDRKFMDIGATVKKQWHKVADWADMTNACIFSGPNIVTSLKTEAKRSKCNSLLLVAEMSSAGNYAKGAYTDECVRLAAEHPDFVIGFICQRKLTNDPGMIHMTPGIQMHLEQTTSSLLLEETTSNLHDSLVNASVSVLPNTLRHSDGFGQQYDTPANAIARGADIIIVGRGIYEAKNPAHAAQLYQHEGWRCAIQAHTRE